MHCLQATLATACLLSSFASAAPQGSTGDSKLIPAEDVPDEPSNPLAERHDTAEKPTFRPTRTSTMITPTTITIGWSEETALRDEDVITTPTAALSQRAQDTWSTLWATTLPASTITIILPTSIGTPSRYSRVTPSRTPTRDSSVSPSQTPTRKSPSTPSWTPHWTSSLTFGFVSGTLSRTPSRTPSRYPIRTSSSTTSRTFPTEMAGTPIDTVITEPYQPMQTSPTFERQEHPEQTNVSAMESSLKRNICPLVFYYTFVWDPVHGVRENETAVQDIEKFNKFFQGEFLNSRGYKAFAITPIEQRITDDLCINFTMPVADEDDPTGGLGSMIDEEDIHLTSIQSVLRLHVCKSNSWQQTFFEYYMINAICEFSEAFADSDAEPRPETPLEEDLRRDVCTLKIRKSMQTPFEEAFDDILCEGRSSIPNYPGGAGPATSFVTIATPTWSV